MRFAAVKRTQPPQPARVPAAELIRRLVVGEPLSQPAPAKTQDLPPDLDQRVRLVGEW
jgi:hypothetical protein